MSDDSEGTSLWDQIDAIPVVNLDNRPERWESLLQSAGDLFPPGKLSRHSASYGREIPGFGEVPWFRGRSTDNRWAARAGCTLSHRKIMEKAVWEGWKTVLILEDDADFSEVTSPEFLEILRDLLSNRDTWDICYLGYSKATGPARQTGVSGERGLFRISGAATTHAYLINEKARDWLVQNLPPEESIWRWTARHRIIDRWYSWNLSKHLKVLAVSPAIVPQAEGYSDIVQQKVDYKNQFPGKVTHKQTYESRLRFACSRICWRARGFLTLLHDSLRYIRKKYNGF